MYTIRKQFRVWDKEKKIMLYDGFVLRPNNPPLEYLEKHNKWCEEHNLETSPIPEYTDYEAEPCEIPTEEQLDYIRGAMHDGSAQYELIDYSNFYGQDNYITMQCTEMHDKDGELIWEYDLLQNGSLVYPVIWYYCSFMWNGQPITDFRDFDKYGKFMTDNFYQSDHFGLETKTLVKVGNLFEDGYKYGFSWRKEM